MTKIDDLDVGMYIAISEERECEVHSQWNDNPFFLFDRPRKPTLPVGLPLKILALALPFACVTDGRHKLSLDLRTIAVQRVDKKYFEAMTDPGEPLNAPARRRRKKREKPDPMKCPRCGNRCVQRLIKPGDGIWGVYCKRCGYDGPPVVPAM